MGCNNCSSSTKSGIPMGCRSNGLCNVNGCDKLNTVDWLADIIPSSNSNDKNVVEVRFKNTRKDFYKNDKKVNLMIGDIVVVEASPGHDIGVVSLTGRLAEVQMKQKNKGDSKFRIRKLYRKARIRELEVWKKVKEHENITMLKAREFASKLKLDMKISDVEYQGDNKKAVFFYTADERIDFRNLIRMLAEEFRTKIEMKQIGARQEAGRIGGIGDCGRELCCSTWLTDFKSVTTAAARYQQLSLNPQKLAGQCGKLKCCLNYELDSYMSMLKEYPNTEIKLKTKRGMARHFKTDIFKRQMWYCYVNEPFNPINMTLAEVKDIIVSNKKGKVPASLMPNDGVEEVETTSGQSGDDLSLRGKNRRFNLRSDVVKDL